MPRVNLWQKSQPWHAVVASASKTVLYFAKSVIVDVAVSSMMLDPDSHGGNLRGAGLTDNLIPAGLIREWALSVAIYVNTPDSSTSSHSLFP